MPERPFYDFLIEFNCDDDEVRRTIMDTSRRTVEPVSACRQRLWPHENAPTATTIAQLERNFNTRRFLQRKIIVDSERFKHGQCEHQYTIL